MVRDNIELVDNDYFRIPLIRPSRKIKFKGISFKNILSRWNKFRLNRLKKKLAEKKESLVGMEFSGEQLSSENKRNRVEKKVLKKTQAIARLESKINFRENGEYHSEEFVDSRAIKLKELMMKNLVYNRDSLYSVNEETAEQIMSESNINRVIDEESEKIGARVREIQAEMEAERKAKIAKEQAEKISAEPNKEDTPESTPIVSNDEVAAAIDNEMSKIKINENENSTAKVNKFINEDGTYRLTRNDIDPELRFTYFDRSKLETNETTPEEVIPELNISPFTATERKQPNVESPRKAITPLVDLKSPDFSLNGFPTIKKSVEEPQKENEQTEAREVPVVVPERESYVVKPTKVKLKKSYVEDNDNDDYENLRAQIDKARILESELNTINSKWIEAQKDNSNVSATYSELQKRLSAHNDLVQNECNEKFQSFNEINKDTSQKRELINMINEILGNSGITEETQESKGGRVRR